MTERERLIKLLRDRIDCLGRVRNECGQCVFNKRCFMQGLDYPKALTDYLLENGGIFPVHQISDYVYVIYDDVLDIRVVQGKIIKVSKTSAGIVYDVEIFRNTPFGVGYVLNRHENQIYETYQDAEKVLLLAPKSVARQKEQARKALEEREKR